MYRFRAQSAEGIAQRAWRIDKIKTLDRINKNYKRL
jgi:hypothetical protein